MGWTGRIIEDIVARAHREGRISEPHRAAPQPLADTITEKDFQAAVIREAKKYNWLVYHTHDSRKSEAGFPDLVMVGPNDRTIFAELKSESGKTTAAQENWLERLRAAGNEVYLWRPSDWTTIMEVLK